MIPLQEQARIKFVSFPCSLTFLYISTSLTLENLAHSYLKLSSHKNIVYFLKTLPKNSLLIFAQCYRRRTELDIKRIALSVCRVAYMWLFVLSITGRLWDVCLHNDFMTSVNISLCYQWACNRIQPRLLCRLGWKGMLETPVARQTGEKGLSLFKFLMYLSSISAIETSLFRKPVYETKVPFTPIKQESPELLGSSLSDHMLALIPTHKRHHPNSAALWDSHLW